MMTDAGFGGVRVRSLSAGIATPPFGLARLTPELSPCSGRSEHRAAAADRLDLGRWDALFLLRDFGLVPAVTFLTGHGAQEARVGHAGAAASPARCRSWGRASSSSARPSPPGPTWWARRSLPSSPPCRDRLPPFEAKAARAIVESEFGVPLDTLFKDSPTSPWPRPPSHRFICGRRDRPSRWRSDSQARRGRASSAISSSSTDGRTRPSAGCPLGAGCGRSRSISTFAQSVMIEMDLRFEAAAASELRQNFAEDSSFLVPAVDWRRTSRRVLTLSWVEGIPIDEREAWWRPATTPTKFWARRPRPFSTRAFGTASSTPICIRQLAGERGRQHRRRRFRHHGPGSTPRPGATSPRCCWAS